MVRTILIYIFWAFVLILLLLWFVSGGPHKAVSAAKSLLNPFSLNETGTTTMQLPWQPEATRGPDISSYLDTYGSAYLNTDDSEQDTGAPGANPDFGNPSPYVNAVHLSLDAARESSPSAEYVSISNTTGNALDITGWSLQSTLTGVRAYIPRGASLFSMGTLNQQNDILITSGGSAVITTGYSPVGTSFRANACTGYLNELQSFEPALDQDCPNPSDDLIQTGVSLRILGDACFEYVQSLPACHFPKTLPMSLNTSCRLFIADRYSYNGCVREHNTDTDFARDSWHIYLGAPRELWRNTHDVIRLLDAQGLTVSVISY